MSIITSTYFTEGELKLPIDNISDIDYFITEHEKIILKRLLGYTLYKAFTDGLAVLPTPATKWTNLRDGGTYTDTSGKTQEYEGIQQIIADYVYFKIITDKQYYATDGGIKGANTDNAENANPRYKQSYAWNDLYERSLYLDGYIKAANLIDSGTYEDYDPNYIEPINVFNI